MRKRINPRSRWEIILDILKVTSEEGTRGSHVKKTRIMQKAYLDWHNFQKYFDFLIDEGFIGSNENANGGKSYFLTEKGRELKMQLKNVEGILSTSTQSVIQ
jgi:predicted transcriptional regulator